MSRAVGQSPQGPRGISTEIRTFLIVDVRGYTRFTRDSMVLAGGDDFGHVYLWNAKRGHRAIGRASHPGQRRMGPHRRLDYSQDGKQLVTSGSDGTTRLYDAATGAAIGSPLPGLDNEPAYAAFSPDGRRVYVVYEAGAGFVWDVTADGWRSHACAVAGRSLTRQEWEEFLPDRPYQPVCRASRPLRWRADGPH